jgi:glycosyltransferase involved in cell wall biosynthesis
MNSMTHLHSRIRGLSAADPSRTLPHGDFESTGGINLASITPLILTFNEAPNIRATLEALAWAKQIVVIDSLSNDETLQVLREFPNVTVISRNFDNHTDQWNFGLGQVDTEWVLTLDADYICPPQLRDEITQLDGSFDVYRASFQYNVFGGPLRATLYPPRDILFRTDQFKCRPDGHTQRLDVSGAELGRLSTRIIHDDRKPLTAWLRAQTNYAYLESVKLDASDDAKLSWKDWIRKKIFFAAPLTLVYCLFYRMLILDGWRGIYYSLQRTYAELLLSLVLVDKWIRAKFDNEE